MFASRSSQTNTQNETCGKRRSSPGRAPPPPCTGSFRLQPRKNIPNLTSQSPAPSSSGSGRGRKRGPQTMTSAFGSPTAGLPETTFTGSSFTSVYKGNDKPINGLRAVPRRHNESTTVNSPTFVHNAMQSMCLRSPAPSTPSSQGNFMRDREAGSPFIVFSPSLKPCPNRQRPRSGSFCSIDSSSKPPSSVITAPKIAPMYESPRRKTNGNNNYSNSSEFLSPPRRHRLTVKNPQAPGTPASNRTLPSPHTTPLPRSMTLTPRSKRHREESSRETSTFLSPKELSRETSTFLSPNEKLDKENTPIFSFEGGVESLEEAKRTPSYVPSPYSCSRSSVTPRIAQAVSSFVGESGGGRFRVETRSLLGAQDCTTLGCIISANARAAALDCDGSLSVDSTEPFLLANPNTLAQERDVMNMPPPRPSRRRRMSPARVSIPIDVSTHIKNDLKNIQNEIDIDDDISRDVNPTHGSSTQSQMNDSSSSHDGVKKLNPSSNLPQTKSGKKLEATNSRYGRKHSLRLQPIESYSSLVRIGLSESSSSIKEPTTPPKKSHAFFDSRSPGTPSKNSVRISRSDADNVHLTIASMAVFHQQLSPTFHQQQSPTYHQQMSPNFHQQLSPTFTACSG